MEHYPVYDFHCDLLSHLAGLENGTPYDTDGIGCAVPHLQQGGVAFQVMALFSLTEQGSTDHGRKQARLFRETLLNDTPELGKFGEQASDNAIQILPAIESASVFCEEDEPLDSGFEKLNAIEQETGKVLYISLTHHAENRFGGGNYASKGLTTDGQELLRVMNEKNIAVDFSHTSDALAYDMIDFMEKEGLQLPVLASHSNYRSVYNHVRNLTDDIVREIVKRKGIIGLNLVREFLHPTHPEVLYEHIQYGMEFGHEHIVWGTDYFPSFLFNEPERIPYFFPEHEHAGKLPHIIADSPLDEIQKKAICNENAVKFLARHYAG